MINKEIIAQRKEQYGNNFPLISKLFNNYLQNIKNVDIVLTPEDISILMGLMKISRLANSPHHEDSLIDLINYMWIALNYDEYVSLGRIDQPKSPYVDIDKNDFDIDRMIGDINNLVQKTNKTEHNYGDAIDIPILRFLAYIKTKPLD